MELYVSKLPGSGRLYLANAAGEIEFIQCSQCGDIRRPIHFFKHNGKGANSTRHQSYCKACDLNIRNMNRKRKAAK